MEIAFTPSPDVVLVLNTLLDKLENRAKRNTEHATRCIKVLLAELPLPSYFSQTDPEPRLIANRQLQELAKQSLLNLAWLPGESGHLLDAIILQTEGATCNTLYTLLQREPLCDRRARLETLLLADQFRFPAGDWRAGAVRRILSQLRAGKSPSPFSLADAGWNLDLLTVLAALPSLEAETPYRAFSVRIFNDSKRFDELRPALVRLARLAVPQWKHIPKEELLRELNLVANPGYNHFSGNWQFTTASGEILSLGGFVPSIGFPAAQTASIRAVAIHADAVLCIENLTAFHEFTRAQELALRNTHYATRATQHEPSDTCSVFRSLTFALLCILGNPSPSIRRLLRLVPDQTPIYLWSDLDYGGFNILSQLRQKVSPRVQPYLMDIAAFDAHAHLSRPLTRSDERNLKRLASRPELQDVRPVMEHLLKCGLKLEQEALYIGEPAPEAAKGHSAEITCLNPG